ncbi:MAG: 50S ribosomal protein L15 [Planctomycetes bacterium]|nr:50S ribosomal protein L15 [Planctomycetota bacterium]
MMIHEITPKAGKNKKSKRLGRGIGSGKGKTSGRGTKGAGSRSGWSGSIRAGREGGQTPWFRRIPKRGFSNFNFRVEYAAINVSDLQGRFNNGDVVDPAALVKAGLISNTRTPVKILASGELSKKLTVKAAAFSKIAQEKITKAGGTAEVVK